MFRQVVTAIAVFSVLQFAAQPSEAKARRYTITQRHQILGAKINRMERCMEESQPHEVEKWRQVELRKHC
jgi:hypothetical protein